MDTAIENTPPTEKDRFLWRQSVEYATEISRAILGQVREYSPTTRAVDLLKSRIGGALNSLWVLRTYAPHDFGFDGMMVLRGIYDAHIQALYILSEEQESDARAKRFFDYQWIERRRMKKVLDSNPTLFAQTLRQSPRREAAEPAMDNEYERVVREHSRMEKGLSWYPGNLSALANAKGVDLGSEYDILHRQLSGAVHSSPLTLLSGPWVRGESILLLAWRLCFRVLGRIARHHHVRLESNLEDLISDSFRSLFEAPSHEAPTSPPESEDE